MARDRVTGVKWESPAGGGTETDKQPTPVNPAEDYPQVRGVILQRHTGPGEYDHTADEAVGLERDDSDRLMLWDSENSTPVTLTALLSGSGGLNFDDLLLTVAGTVVYNTIGNAVTKGS